MEKSIGKIGVIADYMVAFVNEFGKIHGLTDAQSFKYLWRYGAINMVSECYEAAHTLSFEDVCRSATELCHRNGGALT